MHFGGVIWRMDVSKLPLYMVFDVESIGLHGEGFAVGYVVVNSNGVLQEQQRFVCPQSVASGSDEDRQWVRENTPTMLCNHYTTAEVRQAFWRDWRRWAAEGAVLVADCAWPVEARFLAACIDMDPEGRRWQGPYPLHDVATARLAAGFDPLATVDRLPSEEPKHDPLADARQSARLWLEALAKGRVADKPDLSQPWAWDLNDDDRRNFRAQCGEHAGHVTPVRLGATNTWVPGMVGTNDGLWRYFTHNGKRYRAPRSVLRELSATEFVVARECP